jgi:hypothetical protein
VQLLISAIYLSVGVPKLSFLQFIPFIKFIWNLDLIKFRGYGACHHNSARWKFEVMVTVTEISRNYLFNGNKEIL